MKSPLGMYNHVGKKMTLAFKLKMGIEQIASKDNCFRIMTLVKYHEYYFAKVVCINTDSDFQISVCKRPLVQP